MTLADAIADVEQLRVHRARCSRSDPATTATTARCRVIDMAQPARHRHDRSSTAYPSLTLGTSDTNVLDMAEAFSVFANDGDPPDAAVHQQDRRRRRQGHLRGRHRPASAPCSTNRSPARRRRCSRGVITDGTGTRRPTRPSGRGQDRHDRREQRRLVRRLHAAVHGRGVDGPPGTRRSPMNNVGGVARARRHVPGADLGGVHEARAREPAGRSSSPRPTRSCGRQPERITEEGRKDGLGSIRAAIRAPPPSVPPDATTPATPAGAGPDRTDGPARSATPRLAAMSDSLEALLVVQEHDLALDRLRHRRASLPERAELEARRRRARDARRRAARSSRAERDEVLRRGEAARRRSAALGAKRRRGRPEAVLGHGHLAARAPGDAGRRRDAEAPSRDLDDRELEVMEQRETLDAEIAARDAERAALAAEMDAAARRRSRRRRPRSTPRSAVEDSGAGRAAAAVVAAALLRDYESAPAQNHGAGAARLVGTTCQACQLTIPSTEVDRIRRAGGRGRRVLRQLRRHPRPVNQLGCRSSDAGSDRRGRGRSIYCDGGSRGNPGPAAIGAVVLDPSTDPPSRSRP